MANGRNLSNTYGVDTTRNETGPYNEPNGTSDNPTTYRGFNYLTCPIYLLELVCCGRDNMDHAAGTEVVTVKAGDLIEFAHLRSDPYFWKNYRFDCADGRRVCAYSPWSTDVNHIGPIIAHLFKVPHGHDVRWYDGSGNWVKVYTLGVELRNNHKNPVYWRLFNDSLTPPRFQFKIPIQTPTGQYLLRMDLIWARNGSAEGVGIYPQTYPSCAQIRIESNTSGRPPNGFRIPEDLSPKSPGMCLSQKMANGEAVDKDYMYPGGPLWDGKNLVEDKPEFLKQG